MMYNKEKLMQALFRPGLELLLILLPNLPLFLYSIKYAQTLSPYLLMVIRI